MGTTRLTAEWLAASKDLAIKVIAPFNIVLPSGAQVECDAFVESFGHTKGMLLVSDFKKISPFEKELISEGYGYSTLTEPNEIWVYDREGIIELLNDWSWSGKTEHKPAWLNDEKKPDDEENKTR